jgi:hypothetical protein
MKLSRAILPGTLAAVSAVLLVLPSACNAAQRAKRAPRIGQPLAWAPPRLQNPTTVRVTSAARWLSLDPNRDYRVELPAHPIVGVGGVVIDGGHNVVLIGGEIHVPWHGESTDATSRRGLYLVNQTGTVHIEGVRIGGADLSEGIDLSEPLGAVVQIENVRIDRIRAHDERTWSDNHPDLIQTWAGPAVLRVDGFTGSTDYQGFFLAPNQYGSQAPPRSIDLRRINLISTHRCTCVLLWDSTSTPIHTADLWVAVAASRTLASALWPGREAWPGARRGRPPGGDFVPSGTAGIGYRSPGYAR